MRTLLLLTSSLAATTSGQRDTTLLQRPIKTVDADMVKVGLECSDSRTLVCPQASWIVVMEEKDAEVRPVTVHGARKSTRPAGAVVTIASRADMSRFFQSDKSTVALSMLVTEDTPITVGIALVGISINRTGHSYLLCGEMRVRIEKATDGWKCQAAGR